VTLLSRCVSAALRIVCNLLNDDLYAALVSAAKVMRCIQCSLVFFYIFVSFFVYTSLLSFDKQRVTNEFD